MNKFNQMFGNDEKSKPDDYKSKVEKAYGKNASLNPFLNRKGELVNKYINYQSVADNPNVNSKVKDFIYEATGITPSVSAKRSAVPQNQNYTSGALSGKKGFISAKYESGGYNGGAVSSGGGDYGGISYGVPQFSSKTGSADNFVSWLKKSNPDMGNYFGDYKAGTNEFSNAWKEVYSKYGDKFSNIQTEYAYDNFVKPLADLAKQKTGVDYTRSTALTELLYSTAIQFGSGDLGLSALGNVTSDMNDKDIINASYDKKIANYQNYFKDSSASVQQAVKNRFTNERNDVLSLLNNNNQSLKQGIKIANTDSYNNNAVKGQCVWYVRGRASEKLGKDTGAIGNANEMWYNAKSNARLSATSDNIKPDIIVSYNTGTSPGGQEYGHAIYIEDVVGDTVYYTEGGSGYHKNGTDGVVKTATKQGILNGVNTNGGKIGNGIIGFIDLSEY